MPHTVYIVTDPETIEYLVNDNLDGLKAAVAAGLQPEFDVESFDSEDAALAFCAGLGHGHDERAVPDTFPLRSFEPCDELYIKFLTEI